jgi:hypothetical protein
LDLDDLADRFLGKEYQPLLCGPFANGLHDFYRSESITQPLVASIFWQIFVASPAFGKALEETGTSSKAITGWQIFIVRHNNRHDLVVLDPFFERDEPSIIESVKVTPEDMKAGWTRLLSTIPQSFLPSFIEKNAPNFRLDTAIEAVNNTRFGLMVAREPKMFYTSSTPHPAIPVDSLSGNSVATVGVVTLNAKGQRGVTTARHAVNELATVKIDSQIGKIISSDILTDSCFIELHDSNINAKPVKGPLTGIVPRMYEHVEFEAITSGKVQTIVTGTSLQLPLIVPGMQNIVYTKPVTQCGDSGAALLSDNDSILGFSMARTAYTEMVEFSCWIWAEDVFRAHNLIS